MTGGLVRASLEDIARLRASPAGLPEFLSCGSWVPPMAAFDRHLSSVTIDELRHRFDVDRMVELRIYAKRRRTHAPAPADDSRTLDHLVEAFEDLRTFVRETAAAGAGAIAYLT